MIRICKRFSFDAAHHLPKHLGKCKNMHGHRYFLEITLSGEINEEGMLIDFGELKKIVNEEVIDKYDHQDLNQFWENPTAEIMVWDIAKKLLLSFSKLGMLVEKVRLYETPESYAEWRE